MIDISGATKAVQATSTNTFLLSQNVTPSMAALKASWSTAIEGAYALVEPKIHQDYYTCDEVDALLSLLETAIKLQIATIFNSHTHPVVVAWTLTPNSPMTFTMPTTPYIPMEVFVTKISRPIQITELVPISSVLDVESGVAQTELIEVYSKSPVIGLI
jgi:hypothetical protein